MQQANDAFFNAFGADGGLEYKPAVGDSYTISAIRVDEKPVNRLAPSGSKEFEEQRWRISSVSNTAGRVNPVVLGFKGNASDTILNLDGKTWYVVGRDPGNDPGMQIITIRDKAIPMDYDNE